MEIDMSDAAHDEDEQFSSDSSFYGDDDLKEAFEERSRSFDPRHYWEHVHFNSTQVLSAKPYTSVPTPAEEKSVSSHGLGKPDRMQMEDDRLARLKRKRGSNDPDIAEQQANLNPMAKPMIDIDQKLSPPRNLFEADPMAKQLDENLDAFLQRLQPSKTTIASGPWILVANPHASNQHVYRNQPRFVDEGNALMDVYMARKRSLEEQSPSASAATITMRLKPEREWLEESISNLAKECAVTNGKWMLFPLPKDVDSVWKVVAQGTLEGRLGSAAKVATDANDGKPERLVCVYTKDFTDVKDVKRVLKEMRALSLISNEKGARWIYYKTDAYTYLGINSDNEYKVKASKYNSKGMFAEID